MRHSRKERQFVMETQLPSSSSRSHRTLFLLIGIFLVILFIVFNFWVYSRVTKGGSFLPKNVQQWLSKGVPSANRSYSPQEAPITPTSPPSTPTPLQGPGTYACDPFGTCKHYANPVGKGCPKTFADSMCLGRCGGDKSIWCPN